MDIGLDYWEENVSQLSEISTTEFKELLPVLIEAAQTSPFFEEYLLPAASVNANCWLSDTKNQEV